MTSNNDDLLHDPEAWSKEDGKKLSEVKEVEIKTAAEELAEELESLSKFEAYRLGMAKIIALVLIEDKEMKHKNLFLAKLVKFTTPTWYNDNKPIRDLVDWHLG